MTSTTKAKTAPSLLHSPLRWLRQLYEWVMRGAEHPKAVNGLALLAFIEAIFFPIPVDPLLLAMGSARPRRALWYGVVATLASVTGGLIGYLIGYLLWESSESFFYTYIFSEQNFQLVTDKFQRNAFLAIFLAGLTPIPFKVFTLAAGVAQIALLPFIVGSLVGRGMRFFLVGALLYFFGPAIRTFIEKYFEKITMVTGLIVVIAFVLYQLLS